ncbi:Bidirectional sugar transporter SWEET14 [Triticum urartu]|uniref:Bidirectional sugar transporter SWEET14 n=1 Tax=Triticum urartu TaxID=4572 RepID=M7ZA79_TRIUA|nr:Bidirectional sugar transporter SWEET14 [Triticum urartu]
MSSDDDRLPECDWCGDDRGLCDRPHLVEGRRFSITLQKTFDVEMLPLRVCNGATSASNVISFMTYLAPLPTFYRIYKNKSTQGFQSVPYVVALFSAMLWIYYALLKSDEYLLITINSAGCVIETIYIVLYLAYAHKQARIFTAKILLLLNVGVFGLILLLTLLLTAGERRIVMLGWVCVGFSVSVFVAPLSVIRLVVRTRSVEFMPFSLSLSLTASAVVWFLYGLLIKDKYVALPNILGFAFGVIQMGLYALYRNATPRPAPKELPNILGFAFGVIQMGLYALYRNATPRPAPKEVDAPVSDDARPGGAAAVELPTVKEGAAKKSGVASASDDSKGTLEKLDKAIHVEQV